MQQELEFGIGLLNGQNTQGFTFSNSNPSVFNPTVSTPSNSFLAQVIDQHTAQNYFANSNDQLARSNDAEILGNLDAAVAANQEAISTNNTRIAALNGVTDAYTKQAEAQSTLAAANQTAAKSQTAADNAQTVSNMLAALPENPTSQQIAIINQAIDENPEVFGDQAAAIKSNLSANPPNLDAARSSASSVASSTASTAAADQQAATQAKTNADNAAAAVDGAKKAAVKAGVPESDVASANAASSATSKLQTENAALAADNTNAVNAKKYIEDRRTAASEAAKAEEDRVRGEKDRRYNIGALTPNTSTAELYDLRNINYTNFRGSKGSSAESKAVGADGKETTTTTYRSGASKSYYMHIDYVFSNDLNMSSIKEEYKQTIQPIILNEFQPNEMITIGDFITGPLKFLDKGAAAALGVVGDFAKPATKFMTNVFIDRASKNPEKWLYYKRNRDASKIKAGNDADVWDYIFDPVTKVRNMFRGGKWLNTYELPFFNNNFLEAQWSKNWSGQGITGDFGENVGKVIQDKFAIDYPVQPKFSVNMSQAGRSEFDIEFYLINKDIESLKKNFKFLTAFYAGTSWMNLYGGFVRPPNVYNVICPGRFEIPWAAVDSLVTFEGKLRKIDKEEQLGGEFLKIGLIEKTVYWPDAWKMKIHIKDLSVNNFNMYADYYQHGFSPADYVINEDSAILEASIIAGKAAAYAEAGAKWVTGKKMTQAEIDALAKQRTEQVRSLAGTVERAANSAVPNERGDVMKSLIEVTNNTPNSNSTSLTITDGNGVVTINPNRVSQVRINSSSNLSDVRNQIVQESNLAYDQAIQANQEAIARIKTSATGRELTADEKTKIQNLESMNNELRTQQANMPSTIDTDRKLLEYAARRNMITAGSEIVINDADTAYGTTNLGIVAKTDAAGVTTITQRTVSETRQVSNTPSKGNITYADGSGRQQYTSVHRDVINTEVVTISQTSTDENVQRSESYGAGQIVTTTTDSVPYYRINRKTGRPEVTAAPSEEHKYTTAMVAGTWANNYETQTKYLWERRTTSTEAIKEGE